MIEIINAESRNFNDFGWLKTYWLFSFSSYFDAKNIQFGALRVFNDDMVEPGKGFPTHPHEEMEIVTIVLSGEVTHEDSMGNKSVIKAGDVQRMSAGTGLTHSEFNLTNEPVSFYQIWIFPDKPGLEPSYDQKTFSADQWKNRLFPLASGQGKPDTVTFNTDATIYRCELDGGQTITCDGTSGRRLFIYLKKGSLRVDDSMMEKKDQARIDAEEPLSINALTDSDFILIDVPSCKGWGYSKETLKGAQK